MSRILNRLAGFIDVIRDRLRASPWALIAVIGLLALVLIGAPHKLGVMIWFITVLATSVFLCYWADRAIFGKDLRPHLIKEETMRCARILARALIVAAGVIAAGVRL